MPITKGGAEFNSQGLSKITGTAGIAAHNYPIRYSTAYNQMAYVVARNTVAHSLNMRQYSTLTHVDKDGRANMVDVGPKAESDRAARASGFVEVGPLISKLILENSTKKGNALAVAQLAGIMAAKRTSDLIPLCHPLTLNCVKVELQLNTDLHRVEITAEVKCNGKTGVEMEALTAVSIAALTVYDMCKSAASPDTMRITGIGLVSKTGGTRGDFARE